MLNTIELKNINKTIRGNHILSNINLKLDSGKVYGFVGINGSGKSMLFRLISGLIKQNDGEILLNGKKIGKDNPMLEIGIVLENKNLIMDMTGKDNLKYLSKIRNVIDDKEIDDSMIRVGLEPNDKRIIRRYSLGMKQKIVIAQAIMEKPDVLLLDEPTNALDEKSVELVRKIIAEEKKRGAIVLLASHNKEDIETLCDQVFYINEGHIQN